MPRHDSLHEVAQARPHVSWWKDYLSLTKPRITVMILLTVGVAAFAAQRILGVTLSWWTWLNTLIATGMIAGSASTLNQWYERDRDALMPRTQNRALPSGRLSAFEVAVFGWLLVILGCLYLGLGVNWVAMTFGLVTWIVYCWVYTPMKTMSWWNTAIGTLPGALPVMIGWTAAGGSMWDIDGWELTGIVILWQFPHFMSIAWLYREQYAHAGFRMLTKEEPTGLYAGWHALVPAMVLIPLSVVVLHPASMGGWLVAGLGVAACVGQAWASWLFLCDRNDVSARRLLRSSLLYLPSIMLLVTIRWGLM